MRFAQRIDLQALLPPGLIAPFGFRFVRGFRSTRSLYSRSAFASAAMALSSRQSSHNILITGSHMLLRDVSLISFTRNHAISCVDRYYLSQASLLVLFVLRSLSKTARFAFVSTKSTVEKELLLIGFQPLNATYNSKYTKGKSPNIGGRGWGSQSSYLYRTEYAPVVYWRRIASAAF